MNIKIRVLGILVLVFLMIQIQSTPTALSTNADEKVSQIGDDISSYLENYNLLGFLVTHANNVNNINIALFIDDVSVLSIYSTSSSLFFIVNQAQVKEKEISPELYSKIPLELHDFKFLLNPSRLAIIKVLHDYTQITSSELRNILEISWGVLRQNLQALEKNNYIEIEHKFVDGKASKVVSLNHLAIQ
ncbi:MAG: transcriptional regulator, partial [Candidatus Heimdallarchaeota archaeon]